VSSNPLQQRIAAEMARKVPSAVLMMAMDLARRAGGHAAGVLYYGSMLRGSMLGAPTPEGLLDFYVLLDSTRDWPGSRMAAAANRLLPPNVGYLEGNYLGESLRAKYALMSVAQFQRRMSARSLDTTVWARFCQPCICVLARSENDRRMITDTVCMAVVTAARWAAELGPAAATAEDYWRALFARTYAAELRVESADRSRDIIGADAGRYVALLDAAWQHAGIRHTLLDRGVMAPQLDPDTRRSAMRGWAWRARLGRPLNILRLLKAAFTFDGALDYVAWKIERHRGVRIKVSPWQRRHPLLAAPGLYWRLRRQKLI
jgi:hypothetical protein